MDPEMTKRARFQKMQAKQLDWIIDGILSPDYRSAAREEQDKADRLAALRQIPKDEMSTEERLARETAAAILERES